MSKDVAIEHHQHLWQFDAVCVPIILPNLVIFARCACGEGRHFTVQQLNNWARNT